MLDLRVCIILSSQVILKLLACYMLFMCLSKLFVKSYRLVGYITVAAKEFEYLKI